MQIPGGPISPTCSSGVETMFFSFPLTTVAPKSQYISIGFPTENFSEETNQI